MRRILLPLAAGLATVGLVVLALLRLTAPPPPSAEEASARLALQNEQAERRAAEEALAASLPPAPLPDTLRNVTPGGILPLPPVNGPLKRVAPRLPEVEKREVPDEITVRQPVVLDGGTLEADGLVIRLAGIEAPGLDAACPSHLGGSWPCGVRARTALRAFVRRFAITCSDIARPENGPVTATCRRSTTDLATWMVEQGWALPEDGAPNALVEAAKTARNERKGRWQLEGLPKLDPELSRPVEPEFELDLPGGLQDSPAIQPPPAEGDGRNALSNAANPTP
uniref:thermonuclease family protein n=1 Tax=Stappia sp. TaxID=1870903 RepID=UPI003BA9546D